jgi:hypothetical protein
MKSRFLFCFAALMLTLLGSFTVFATSFVDVQVTTFITVTRSPLVDSSKELSTPYVPDSVAANRLQARHCNFNACMQEFLIFSTSYTPICATYTTIVDTCIDPFPSRVSKWCSSLPTKVSSACSCLMASLFPSGVPLSLLSGISEPSTTESVNSQTSSSQPIVSQQGNSQPVASLSQNAGLTLVSSGSSISLSGNPQSLINGGTPITSGSFVTNSGAPQPSTNGETPSGSSAINTGAPQSSATGKHSITSGSSSTNSTSQSLLSATGSVVSGSAVPSSTLQSLPSAQGSSLSGNATTNTASQSSISAPGLHC